MRRLPMSVRNMAVLGMLVGLLTLLALSPALMSSAHGARQNMTACQLTDLSLAVSEHEHSTRSYTVGECESVTLSSDVLLEPINLQICYGQHKEWCGSPFGRDSWTCVQSGAPYSIAYLPSGTKYHLRYKTCATESRPFTTVLHLDY
jgi:hypothetical protein